MSLRSCGGCGRTQQNLGTVMPCGGGRDAKLSLPLGGDTSTSSRRNGLCITATLEVDLFPYKLRCLFLGIITTDFKCIQHCRKFYSHTLAMMDKFVLASSGILWYEAL